MGYYAHLDIDRPEHRSCQPDYHFQQVGDALALRLANLEHCLKELEEVRPHDPMHPLFDRYFYSHFVSDDIPYTVQGLLQLIAEVKAEIAERDTQWLAQQHFLTTIRNTGADPDGQVVFTAVFLPALSRCA